MLTPKRKIADLCRRFSQVAGDHPVLMAYEEFVARVDREIERLTALYRAHLRCGPGCDMCCHVERTVNVLEAFWIWRALARERRSLPEPRSGQCALLTDGLCAVYTARPILCRTHGLPLLYFAGGEVGVTYCELNFQHLHPSNFGADEILDMGPVNEELLSLDRRFCEEILGQTWNPTARVALAELVRCQRDHREPATRKESPL